jgi:prophage endopeptidase
MMIPISPKLIGYGILAAGLAYGSYTVKNAFDERDELKVENAEIKLSRDTAIASLGLYQEANENQVKLISEYQVKLDEKQKKIDSDERAVNSGVKRVYVKAACPASNPTTANTATTPHFAQLNPSAGGTYFRLKRGIVELEENYQLCLDTLIAERKKPGG